MDAARLRGIPLLSDLSEKQLQRVARLADEVEVPEGKHLTEQGHFSHEFMIIEDGTADVFEHDEKVNQMGPGDFFGEIGLLDPTGRRSATVVATSPMRLIVIGPREFVSLTDEMREVSEELRAAATRRMTEKKINPPE